MKIPLQIRKLVLIKTILMPKLQEIYLESWLRKFRGYKTKLSFTEKRVLYPGLESWHGDEGMSYTYSGIRMDAKPWTKNLLVIKESIEPIAKTTFNSVLINYYRDGKDQGSLA